MIRRSLRLPLILLLAACHAPVTVVTPQGKTAYTADQVVVRVRELQNAAIQANATLVNGQPGLDTATTRIVVQTCVSLAQTLAATPTGWPATIKTAWASFRVQAPQLFLGTTPVALLVQSLDVVIAAL
jgi:hypothetical protein